MLNTDFSYDLTEGTLSRYIVEGDGYSRDICYSYDGFGRTSSVTRSLTEFDGTGSIGQNIAYGYIQTSDPDDGTITYNRIGSVTNEYTVTADDETTTVASETFTYTYDASGNITEIKNNGSTLFRYHYDLLDQLTREDNAQSGRTYVYEYDNAGNIKSKKTYGYTTSATVSTTLYSTQTYGYGSGISGDILTSLNGSSITYDGTLSPLNYVLSGDDCALTWTQGRRLSHIISDDGSREYSYTYNADGIRTSKTVNGVEHIYHLSGTRILDEEWVSGSTRNLLIYIYDASGQPIGINYLKCVGNTVTKEAYLLGTNIQGDITCIYDTAGNRVVTYTYDAWGKILSVTGTAANTIGRYNPFRYRGYYYDNETGFYYLNSRYYDPAVGRFLNADGYINANGDLIGFNMFAYCSNNPVMGYDPSGESILGALVLLGVVAISALLLTSCGGEQPPHVIASGSADQELIDYLVPGGCEDEVGALNKAIDELTPYLNDSHESGGYIYKRSNGKYYFSGVTQKGATATSCIIDMSGAPSDATIVATIHTHPAAREMGRLIFTAKEWRYVTRHNCTSYVFDVDGHVFALSPSSKDYMDYSQYK